MSDITVMLVIVALVILIFVKGMMNQRKAERDYLANYKKEYGLKLSKAYSADELLCIKSYYENKLTDNDRALTVDDITWNDLDMDLLYKRIDKTLSQPGAEVLYDILRRPLNSEDVSKLEEQITYFSNNEIDREKLVLMLYKIGNGSKISFSTHLRELEKCESLNSMKHYFCLIFGVVSLMAIFFNPPLGFILMFVSLFYNIFSYFADKGKVQDYVSTCASILKLIKYSELLVNTPVGGIESEKNEIKEIIKNAKKIRTGAFLVMNQGGATGNFADIILDYFRMYFHLDLLVFNNMLKLGRKYKKEYLRLWEIIGRIDALIAIGNYRASLPYYANPEFDESVKYSCEELYHPLLDCPVSNSVKLDKCALLTGSNASGKSTFLKTVAINAILAQTINTVCAKKYTAPHFCVMTSMALSDNIEAGQSYYMAEIKALKRIIESESVEHKVLCCIDEVLRGTNTAERISASSAVLEHISRLGFVCFAATHDLELSVLLSKYYDNYHFSENVEDDRITFPYKLYEGATKSRNAIKLLSFMGFDKMIVEDADKRCKNFLENKVWM